MLPDHGNCFSFIAHPFLVSLGDTTQRGRLLYLAQRIIKGKTRYFISESFKDGDYCRSSDLFDLGTSPAKYIVYPGGNAYYIDEVVEDRLCSLGVKAHVDDMEDMFWPFVKPEIRRVLESSRERAKARRKRMSIKPHEEEHIRTQVAEFDKRRIHYLRCGRIDQGWIGRMPVQLYKWAFGTSRDEIEQRFMKMECCLKASELKSYTYVIFDLQRFFTESSAKKMPQALDQNRVDKHFVEELCALNSDASFWAGDEVGDFLHPYLIRYLIMFFDYDYGQDSFWRDYIKGFMNARRSWRAPARKSTVTFEQASTIFGVKEDVLRTMTKRSLVRLYRRMAQKLHPDKGGSHEKFIQLTEAYQKLLKSKGETPRWFTKR